METERYRLLAGIVAAHPNRQVVGRTRLQKTVKLLQRLGLPTDYEYMLHFFGPYSEGVQAEIGLLEQAGLIDEVQQTSQEGRSYYVMTAPQDAELQELKKYDPAIQLMSQTSAVALELAATYDSFREAGMNHANAIQLLHQKKGSKCEHSNEERAMALLSSLGLPTS